MRPDPQARRIYAWEDTFRSFGERSLTIKLARRVVRRCCRRYGIKAPKVKLLPRKSREWSYHETNRDLIALNWHQCNHPIACHEAAHAICHSRFGDTVEDHGPEFMGIYLDLLILHSVAPREALEASLKARGITWRRVRRR